MLLFVITFLQNVSSTLKHLHQNEL